MDLLTRLVQFLLITKMSHIYFWTYQDIMEEGHQHFSIFFYLMCVFLKNTLLVQKAKTESTNKPDCHQFLQL